MLAMFGFHDHIVDRRSGRPMPHYSWEGERVITWTAWASSAISLIGAAWYYEKWQAWEGPLQLTLASILLGGIAYWRHRILARKRAMMRQAVEAYDSMLAKPFR
jgi:hypothetical protein